LKQNPQKITKNNTKTEKPFLQTPEHDKTRHEKNNKAIKLEGLTSLASLEALDG
jgi:hypothetical protein